MVAETQRQSLELLGLSGTDAVQYLWIKALVESGKMPTTIILNTTDSPISIPVTP